MAAKVKVVVTGLKSIDRKLARLPYKIQGKVVRPAMRAGMKLVLAAMKAEVPVDTGLTKEHVKLHVTPKKMIKKGQRSSTIAMEVHVESDPGLVRTTEAGERYFYPALIQYGSKDHPPNRFGTRAFDRAGEAVRQRTIALLKDGVGREIKSL